MDLSQDSTFFGETRVSMATPAWCRAFRAGWRLSHCEVRSKGSPTTKSTEMKAPESFTGKNSGKSGS